MATTITTTKNLRYHLGMRNGGSRYIDIENPTTDTAVIASNIATINQELDPNQSMNAIFEGILVGDAYFDGDTDAVVTSVTSAEIIETQKIVTKNTVFQ